MTARRISGWVALASGILLLIAIAGAAAASIAGSSTSAYWPMGPGMMGYGPMGPGMMGFGNAGPAAGAIPGATEVRVQATNFGFLPNEIRLPKGTDVNLTFNNPIVNGVVHDFTVPALGIHIVANSGETLTVGLRSLAAGHYDAYCSVPGHAGLGIRATVVVE